MPRQPTTHRPRARRPLSVLLAAGLALGAPTATPEDPETVEVVVEGVDGQALKNVLLFLEIDDLDGQAAPSEARLHWLHGRAAEEIAQALEPFGYYAPDVESTLERSPGGWLARYRIDPGEPIPVTRLDVRIEGEGLDDPAVQRVVAGLALSEGAPLSHPDYEEAKRSLISVATSRGYFDARMLTSQIRIDLDAYTAAIVLHFDTGPRYRFGTVSFRQEELDPAFLRRYLSFEEGDPYRAGALLGLQSALADTDYFSRVEIDASPEDAKDHTIPVNVVLEPRKPLKLVAGAGFGTDTGARVKLGLERRRVNRKGHRYKVDLLLSQVKYSLTAEYMIPGKDPRSDQYVLRAGLSDEETEGKDSTKAVLGFSRRRQDGPWIKTLSLDFERETFRIGSTERTSTLLIPGIDWTRIDAENRLDVDKGSRLSLRLRGAYEGLLSDVSFLQPTVSTKWIRSFGERHRVLLRGDAGTTWVSGFDSLPSSLRYFAGGDQSVRGYALDSIGPRDAEDEVIGGRHLLVGSVEYEYAFRDKWSVAAFVDAGDAFDDVPEPKVGVGFGLRWQSPVGPIRVDLASGLNEPGDTIRLHLTIGPDL